MYPFSGGDIFIHAKCNNRSKLFELAQRIMRELPSGSVEKFEDVYGWVYQNGRDLSGFIDGTENPADDESREKVSFLISSTHLLVLSTFRILPSVNYLY